MSSQSCISWDPSYLIYGMIAGFRVDLLIWLIHLWLICRRRGYLDLGPIWGYLVESNLPPAGRWPWALAHNFRWETLLLWLLDLCKNAQIMKKTQSFSTMGFSQRKNIPILNSGYFLLYLYVLARFIPSKYPHCFTNVDPKFFDGSTPFLTVGMASLPMKWADLSLRSPWLRRSSPPRLDGWPPKIFRPVSCWS